VLELLNSGALSLWLRAAGWSTPPVELTLFQAAPAFVLPTEPDPETAAILQRYLATLSSQGLSTREQGVWLQSGTTLLASNRDYVPLPAASITKVATSLVALQTWGPDFQFETLVTATGPIQQGVVQGDLVIRGGGDPMMVWEEAFAIAAALQAMGITQVTGNLVIMGNFLMNFEPKPDKAGALFKQALDSRNWSAMAAEQFKNMPPGTLRPQVAIAGAVRVLDASALPANQTLLLRHRSLPLSALLKLMNVYSNNVIAQSLADSAGGHAVVAQKAAWLAGVPSEEILLINGSGLGTENRISPRAACALLAAVQRYLQGHGMTVADLFPISGVNLGTIEDRAIPQGTPVKTGTLSDVSALVGALPTRDRGLVWFAILNRGADLDNLRAQQDQLLRQLTNQWGTTALPLAITPQRYLQTADIQLGTRDRNELLLPVQRPLNLGG